MSRRQSLLILLLLVLVGLALRLYAYIGPFTIDCFQNSQLAYQFSSGEFDISKEYYAANRIGFLFPIGVAVLLLKGSYFSFSLVGLLCSLGCIVLAFVLGARLYGRRVGLVAAALVSVLPMEVTYWSPILVDGVSPFYWGLSLTFFYLGLDDDPPIARRGLLLFASGTVLGLAAYTREHAPIVFLVMLAYLAVRRARAPLRLLWVLAGFVLVVLVGESYYLSVTGIAFLRLRRLMEHFGPGANANDAGALEVGHFQGIHPWFLQAMLASPDYFGCIFWLAWIAALVLLLRRSKQDSFLLTWFLALYVVMDLLLRTFVRLLAYPPYINVLELPGALLAARLMAPHLKSAPRPATPWAVALGWLAALGGVCILVLHSALARVVDASASHLGHWGQAHAHDARLATVPIIVGSLVLAAGLWLALRRARFGWGSAAFVFLIVSSVLITPQGIPWRRNEAAPLRAMAEIIAKDRRPVFLTSLWSGTGLSFFLHYHTNFRRYWNRWESVVPRQSGPVIAFQEVPQAADSLPDSAYVLIDKRPLARMRAGTPSPADVVKLPPYVSAPPPPWRLLYDSRDYALYRVQHP